MIYVATDIHGRGYLHVVAYDDVAEFRNVALKWLESRDAAWEITARSTIDDVCHALRDAGPGFGARSHRRVSRADALKMKREGVTTYAF